MTDIHDPVYQQCLTAAKRDFDALYPELQKMEAQIINLRRLIHAISNLLEEEIEEVYEYTSVSKNLTYTHVSGPRSRIIKGKADE